MFRVEAGEEVADVLPSKTIVLFVVPCTADVDVSFVRGKGGIGDDVVDSGEDSETSFKGSGIVGKIKGVEVLEHGSTFLVPSASEGTDEMSIGDADLGLPTFELSKA